MSDRPGHFKYDSPGAYQPNRRIASGNYGPGTRFQYQGRDPMDMRVSDSSGGFADPNIGLNPMELFMRMQRDVSSIGGDPNEGLTPFQQSRQMGINPGSISGMFNRGGGSFNQQHPNFYSKGGLGFFDPDKDMDTGDFWSGLGKSMGGGIKSFFGKPLQVVNTALGIGDYFQKNKAMGQYGDYLGMLRGQMGEQKAMSDKTWGAFTEQRDADKARVAKFDESQKLVEV